MKKTCRANSNSSFRQSDDHNNTMKRRIKIVPVTILLLCILDTSRPFIIKPLPSYHHRSISSSRRITTLHFPRLYSSNEKSSKSTTTTTTKTVPPSSPLTTTTSSSSTLPPNNNSTTATTTTSSSPPTISPEVQLLRSKARQLLIEANLAETSLRESKTLLLKKKTTSADDLINELSLQKNDEDLINALRNKTTTTRLLLSTEELMTTVVTRLYERERRLRMESGERTTDNVIRSLSTTTTTQASFQIGSDDNVRPSYNNETAASLSLLLERLLSAVDVLDAERIAKRESLLQRKLTTNELDDLRLVGKLRQCLKDLDRKEREVMVRRRVVQGNNETGGGGGGGIEEFVRETLGGRNNETVDAVGGGMGRDGNMSRLLIDMMTVPMWVPSSLLGFIITGQNSLSDSDYSLVKNKVLPGSSFFVTSSSSCRVAAIFRGHFTKSVTYSKNNNNASSSTTSEVSSSDVVFQNVMNRLDSIDDGRLSERVQLFLIDDPEWGREGGDEREERTGGRSQGTGVAPPVLLMVAKGVSPEQEGERGVANRILVNLSILATLFTTFAYALTTYALNPTFFSNVVNDHNLSLLPSTIIPIMIGTILLQAIHEGSHSLVARHYNMTLGTPVPLPSLQIGSFGCITPLRSFPPNRTSLLDLSLSGPVLTLLLSLGIITTGLILTINAPSMEVLSTYPVLPAALFKSSCLMGGVTSVLAPKVLTLPSSQPVPIHPLLAIGLTGLLSSALNLLPIGRLDGGRAAQAVFGRRTAQSLSFLTMVLLALSALSGSSVLSIFWGLIVTIFQRGGEMNCRDEVSEVDDGRFWGYVVVIGLVGCVLVPWPGGGAF